MNDDHQRNKCAVYKKLREGRAKRNDFCPKCQAIEDFNKFTSGQLNDADEKQVLVIAIEGAPACGKTNVIMSNCEDGDIIIVPNNYIRESTIMQLKQAGK